MPLTKLFVANRIRMSQLFVLLILLVRGGSVYVATRTTRTEEGPAFDGRESLAQLLRLRSVIMAAVFRASDQG